MSRAQDASGSDRRLLKGYRWRMGGITPRQG
jgi:hypothetical protein